MIFPPLTVKFSTIRIFPRPWTYIVIEDHRFIGGCPDIDFDTKHIFKITSEIE
jgi:hypothetical protein